MPSLWTSVSHSRLSAVGKNATAVALLVIMAGCQQGTVAPSQWPTSTASAQASALAACPSAAAPGGPQVVLKNLPAPEDLAFGLDARLLFSDITAGTVSALNADGSLERIVGGLSAPEGIVPRGLHYGSGSILVAEQGRNRVVSIDLASHAISLWRAFPNRTGKDGIDGIGPELSNGDIVVPDSPNGVVWRVSGDGKTATQIASGMVRPVGAAVDPAGRIFIADEGGALWILDPARHRFATLPTPDDVLVSRQGHVFVNTLGDNAIHELDGQGHQVSVITGIQQPQGIALDSADNLYYTEFNSGRILRVVRSFAVDPPKVTRTAQGTYLICPVIHRAPGFNNLLELQVGSSTKTAILQLVQPGTDSSGAIELRTSEPSIAIGVVANAGGNILSLALTVRLSP
jgi:DNA-binding beta-propeller fold protein YncE